ncbi:hypothetical protein U0070_022426 [Myodes glareolus]|uniref:Uncharacterized protein n=1 Tax=Myodes glareolus TaxID=447135 RepID=A0AAW0HH13_MYOGA
MRNLLQTLHKRKHMVQEGEYPNRLDPKNPVYAEETSPSVIVNGFSERLRTSHIQRIWLDHDSGRSTQSLAVNLCICFHQLLDEGSVMIFKTVINLITGEGLLMEKVVDGPGCTQVFLVEQQHGCRCRKRCGPLPSVIPEVGEHSPGDL